MCPGCGRCGRVDPAPAPQRAPLRAGVARCGGGGRASPGGVPSTVVRGAWCQALSLPRPPVLWSGQRAAMLVEESPAPHYIMVEDSLAPQCIVVEESPSPMSGIINRPSLVVESPEPTEDRAGPSSPVPMSGTKDRPSLVDDSLVVPKVNNLCGGGGTPVEGGSATLPINVVSPPSTTSPMEEPQPWVLPDRGGDPEVATGLEPVFASHPRIQSPTVVHESPQYIVVDESPLPPPQPNTVGPISPPPSPRPLRRLTSSECTESRT